MCHRSLGYALAPGSRRNAYFAGVGAWADGDPVSAAALLRASLAAPGPAADDDAATESDVHAWYDAAARTALEALGEEGEA